MAPPSVPDPAAPLVTTRGDRRRLEFLAGDVQSEMRLSAPYALVLAYSRAMMAFALFVPRPRHIVMVGLGGGSLVKFCHRHFPHTRLTVIEVRADVIALRAQFCVPPDDARLRVVHADAASYLAAAPASADVLLVDGFDAAGLPDALASARFHADCRAALRDGGVLVANIFTYDTRYGAVLANLRAAFDGRVCWFDGVADNNQIVFAVKHAGGTPGGRALRVQRLVSHASGTGWGALNRLFARLWVAWLARRRVADPPHAR